MFVTAHAWNRLNDRMGWYNARPYIVTLEGLAGEPGTVAYVLGRLSGKVHTHDGSNGDVIVALAVDGSIETVFYRRSTQDMSARFFGASRVEEVLA